MNTWMPFLRILSAMVCMVKVFPAPEQPKIQMLLFLYCLESKISAMTKIILNMEDEEAQRVKTILHLSETEVMNITHFQRGNGLISTNNNNITVEFKASNLEKELITTDRQELLEILAKQKKQAV